MNLTNQSFTSTEFTIVHSLEPNIRKKAFEFEDFLSDKYKAPFVIPIPDDITDYEAPRIIIESKHGYSKILVFPTKIQLITTYDQNFRNDPDKVFNYYINHSYELLNAFETILKNTRLLYCGTVINIKIDVNVDNIVDHLSEVFLKTNEISKLYDINLRFVYPYKNTYFLNFHISNIREYNRKQNASIDQSIKHSPSLSLFNKLKDGISLKLDFNNRLEYNNNANYEFSKDNINNLFQLLKKFSTDNISDILQKGKINVDSNVNN